MGQAMGHRTGARAQIGGRRRAFLLVVAAACLGCTVVDSSGSPTSQPGAPGAGGSIAAGPDPDGALAATEGATTPSTRQRAIPTVPATPPNQRPPQFVLVSFDGTGGLLPFTYWLDVAERADAHFTFFLSGVYLLDRSTAEEYDPPRRAKGSSDIGFIPVTDGSDPRTELEHLLANLEGAWWGGHEIGTHFNGHFCGPTGVNQWTTDEWATEIAEFDAFLTDYATIHSLDPGHIDLSFGPDEIIGGRTPCLEGDKPSLYAAEVAAGFRYDTSSTTSQFRWPELMPNGLWDMSVASVPVAGTGRQTLLMDYNLYYFQSDGEPGNPANRDRWRKQARDTLQLALDDAYTGNRAPVVIGNHFNSWNGNIYTEALADFVLANCQRPEVICASHEMVVNWLDGLEPGALESFQAGAFPKTDLAGAELPGPTAPPGTALPTTGSA